MPTPGSDEPTITFSIAEAWRIYDALLETAYLVAELPALDEQVKATENNRVAELIYRRIHES